MNAWRLRAGCGGCGHCYVVKYQGVAGLPATSSYSTACVHVETLLLTSYFMLAADALCDDCRPLARSERCEDVACRRAWL